MIETINDAVQCPLYIKKLTDIIGFSTSDSLLVISGKY